MKRKDTQTSSISQDRAKALSCEKRSRLKSLAAVSLGALIILGALYLHTLPLVQDVKVSFKESGIDVSAFTYSDVKEYGEIISTLQANPVR